jgi:hypothetical protein
MQNESIALAHTQLRSSFRVERTLRSKGRVESGAFLRQSSIAHCIASSRLTTNFRQLFADWGLVVIEIQIRIQVF